MSKEALLDYLTGHKEDMIRDLGRLVGLESPSDDVAAVDELLSWIASTLQDYGEGVSIERAPGGRQADHLVARLGKGAGPRLLILAHADTVWPKGTIKTRPFRIEGGRASGPGAFDMKGGIVLVLWALRALRALKRKPGRPVTVLCNSDEEIGSPTSHQVIETEAHRSLATLVVEPAMPNGDLKTWRKGVGQFRLEVRGRAAHAGADPGKGVSAIEEVASQILALGKLADHAAGTTVNVGVIGGGTRRNVIAGAAWAEIDVRVLRSSEIARVETAIRGIQPVLPGARVTVDGRMVHPPMERTDGNLRLFRVAQSLAAGLGLVIGESGTGGASDGNLTSSLGVPTLDGLGVVGDGAHADTEFVDLASLPVRAALLARLIEAV